jgi:hypothetical protein
LFTITLLTQITDGDFYLCPRQRCRLLRVADQDPHELFSLTEQACYV